MRELLQLVDEQRNLGNVKSLAKSIMNAQGISSLEQHFSGPTKWKNPACKMLNPFKNLQKASQDTSKQFRGSRMQNMNGTQLQSQDCKAHQLEIFCAFWKVFLVHA